MSLAFEHLKNQNFRAPVLTHLDIGGGPDISPEHTEEFMGKLEGIRAVKRARSNPDDQFIVIDPKLSMELADAIEYELPNVSFIEGQVDTKHPLPFKDGAIDEVEVNHLFYPLIYTSHLQPAEDDFRKRKKEFEADMLATPSQVEIKLGMSMSEFFKSLYERGALLQDEGGAEDFNEYVAILKEASRVLKPGGRLVLAESWRRMDAIVRIMSSDEQHLGDGALLVGLGLEFVSLTDNDDPDRSTYAEGNAAMQDIWLSEENKSEAEKFRPMLLTLQKR